MATEFNARIKNKRDTDENFKSANPTLLKGEIAIVDAGDEVKIKVGNGTSGYNDLDFVGEASAAGICLYNTEEKPLAAFSWDEIEQISALGLGENYFSAGDEKDGRKIAGFDDDGGIQWSEV